MKSIPTLTVLACTTLLASADIDRRELRIEDCPPAVRATVDVPVRVRVTGLPRSTKATVQARVDGRYVRVGTVRTSTTGRALLPAFTPPEAGSYVVRLTPTGRPPLYLRIVAR